MTQKNLVFNALLMSGISSYLQKSGGHLKAEIFRELSTRIHIMFP